MNAEAIVHLKEATNQLPKSVAALGLLMLAKSTGAAWGTEGQVLASLKPETSLDYMVLGAVQTELDPAKAVANLDRGVELGAGALSRLLRAQSMIWVALTTGALADVRKAIGDAEFADTLLSKTNPVAVATTLNARLIEAKLLENQDERVRREVLAQAAAEAAALLSFTNCQAAGQARRDYFDCIGDEEHFAREVERMMANFHQQSYLERYAILLFGGGDSRRALELLNQDPADPSSFSADVIRECCLADLTRDPQQALNSRKRHRDSGFGALYEAAALLPLGLTSQAQEEIKQIKEGFSFYFRFRNGWYEHLFNYYIGQIGPDALIQDAGQSLLNQCEGHFAIALMNLSQGHRAEAKRHFQECVRTRVFDWLEYRDSRALLQRMEADPNWPPWIPKK
jgi:hypothetical protein